MKKYLIEYVKANVGSPNYEMVTQLKPDGSMSNLRGSCSNFDEIPSPFPTKNIGRAKEIQDKFDYTIEANFEHKFMWRDFRKVWHECTESKYQWCKTKFISIKIVFKFIPNES